LEFRGLSGDIVETAYGKKFIAEAPIFNPKNLVESGWMLDDESPYRPRALKMENWVHCVAFDRVPQLFRRKHGLMETVHF
jgi:hypothetical protein